MQNRGFSVVGILIVLAVVVVLGALAAFAVRNGLVAKDETVKAAWGDIDAQLQRRADLIPNLVKTVKGYAAHEDKVFAEVNASRERLLAAGSVRAKAEAGAALDGALGRMFAIAESYPELKASENFARLQDELAGTENRVAVARTRYNEAVKTLNAAIRMFPGSYFAPELGLKSAEYFTPPAGEKSVQAAPRVDFGAEESAAE